MTPRIAPLSEPYAPAVAAQLACWDLHDALVLRVVDALHETGSVDDALWAHLAAEFTEAQLLDLLLLRGWYHAISSAANAARVEPEDGAPRFADVRG